MRRRTCILSLDLCINLTQKITWLSPNYRSDPFAETVADVLEADPFAETVAEVLEAIIEAAPVAVATGGGTVAAAAVIANPPLPLTLASGVPPGMFFQINKKQFCV